MSLHRPSDVPRVKFESSERMLRIYLTGFMGAGKTTVGRLLAHALGWRFLDLDQEIENAAGISIKEIFERLGEAYFRGLETEALRRTLALAHVVVATGGGTATIDGNLDLMRQDGVSVWLNPEIDTILRRVGHEGKEDRPLFQDETQAMRLFWQRLPAYRRCDVKVDVGASEEPQEVAERIVFLVREQRCVT